MDLQCLWLEHVTLASDQFAAPLGEGVELAMPKALKRVVLASDAMSLLTWRDCPALELAVLACPFLREAHFDSCDRLNDDVLRTLGDGSVPPALPAPYYHLPLRGCCPRLRCESLSSTSYLTVHLLELLHCVHPLHPCESSWLQIAFQHTLSSSA